MINATYNGQTYQDVTTLVASDGTYNATVTLTESGGGGDVGGLTEYNSQTVVLTQEALPSGPLGVKIAHGLTKAPKIIRMTLNYSGASEDHKGYVFGLIGACNVGDTDRLLALASNASSGAFSSTYKLDKVASSGDITTYGYWAVDSDYLYLARPTNNQNYDSENSYTIECWA